MKITGAERKLKQMTDYHPLIARAVEGLDNSTGEARRALYERARTALVTQLRSVEPALSESEITKERLALEDAIRKVEAEAARKARDASRGRRHRAAAPRRAAAAPPPPRRRTSRRRAEAADTAAAAGPPPKRRMRRRRVGAAADRPRATAERPPSSPGRRRPQRLSRRRQRGRTTSAARRRKSAQSARDTRDSYGHGSVAPTLPPGEEPAASAAGPAFDRTRCRRPMLRPRAHRHRRCRSNSATSCEDEQPAMPPSARQPPLTQRCRKNRASSRARRVPIAA